MVVISEQSEKINDQLKIILKLYTVPDAKLKKNHLVGERKVKEVWGQPFSYF